MSVSKSQLSNGLNQVASIRALGQELSTFPEIGNSTLQLEVIAVGQKLISESYAMEERILAQSLYDDDYTPLDENDFEDFIEDFNA